jgi:hydroxymethylbilane synthase
MEGKNFFTKELEDAQLEGRIDLAVHSLKDLATEMPPGLTLTAMVGREDPRDVLLARPGAIDEDKLAAGDVLPLKTGAKIGTSAARRQAQIRYLTDDLEIVDLRGNVPTRVNRLREGLYDGILLAHAGLLRLELDVNDLFVKVLDADEFVPAPAQGMLGVQCRENDPWQKSLTRLDCAEAGLAVAAERDLLQRLEGGCQLPFGVNIQQDGDEWRLEVFLAGSGDEPLRLTLEGSDLDTLVAECWEMISEYRGV